MIELTIFISSFLIRQLGNSHLNSHLNSMKIYCFWVYYITSTQLVPVHTAFHCIPQEYVKIKLKRMDIIS